MSFFTDTPEKQAAREQFKQAAQAANLALKNSLKAVKPKLSKEEKKALTLSKKSNP